MRCATRSRGNGCPELAQAQVKHTEAMELCGLYAGADVLHGGHLRGGRVDRE